MVKKLLFEKRLSQSGFTLIEIVVAMAIVAFISTGLVSAIAQLVNVNHLSNNRMTAIKQIENALHIISQDVQMAQTVTIGGTSFFSLSWYERDESRQDYSKLHQAIYTLTPEGLLQKFDSLTSFGQTPVTTTTNIAQDIVSDPLLTNCSFSPAESPYEGIFTIQITATSGDHKSATETRNAQILLRSNP